MTLDDTLEDDTRVHEVGRDVLWSESWYFDFANLDGSAGGFVRVGAYPNLGVSWWWAYVVAAGEGRPVVAGEHVEVPAGDRLAAPFRLDEPGFRLDVAQGSTGMQAGTGAPWTLRASGAGFEIDVEWRRTAHPYRYRRGNRYEQPGWACGKVRAGAAALEVNGPAQADHSWGVRDWWRFGWTWCAGWLDDGSRFQATLLDARNRVAPDGYLHSAEGETVPVRDVEVALLPVGIDARLEGHSLALRDVATVDLDLVGPDGRDARLARSMTTVRAADGRTGIGWRERNQPARREARSRPSLRD